MTGEIVNLRRARKQKARDGRVEAAATNRAKFGRSKAERLRDETEAERRRKLLDGHKRDDEPSS